MAVTKYMNRINAASELDVGFDSERHRSSTQAAIHEHSYGITSDPLTQFAVVFSALIHDGTLSEIFVPQVFHRGSLNFFFVCCRFSATPRCTESHFYQGE